jgi:hypothetical protein
MDGDEWNDATNAGDGAPPAAPQAPPAPRAAPADPREHWCHCGAWGDVGQGRGVALPEHRAEIGYDHAGAWRME